VNDPTPDPTPAPAAGPGPFLFLRRVDREPAPTAPAQSSEAYTWTALAEAVSRVTARFHGLTDPGPSGDVAPEDVTTTLAIVCVALLQGLLPADRAAGLLKAFGAEAARTDPGQR
jgi:hypothetical protein